MPFRWALWLLGDGNSSEILERHCPIFLLVVVAVVVAVAGYCFWLACRGFVSKKTRTTRTKFVSPMRMFYINTRKDISSSSSQSVLTTRCYGIYVCSWAALCNIRRQERVMANVYCGWLLPRFAKVGNPGPVSPSIVIIYYFVARWNQSAPPFDLAHFLYVPPIGEDTTTQRPVTPLSRANTKNSRLEVNRVVLISSRQL